MGQKSNPIGLRLGIIRSWDANWFDERNFAGKLHEDMVVRQYLRNRLQRAGVSRVVSNGEFSRRLPDLIAQYRRD